MFPVCLIVSSDSDRVAALQRDLKEHGLKLFGIPDTASLRPILTQWGFDAILCDGEGSADIDAAIRSLRRDQRAPIVVLASQAGEGVLISALEAGATELIARNTSSRLIAVKLLRLIDLSSGASGDEPRAVSLGELHLDPQRAEAVFGDRLMRLTKGEFELLLLLATQSGRFVHRETIMRTIGRTPEGESRRCADMHVCRIRRKLREVGASSLELETVYGRGYALRLRDSERTC